MKKIAKFGLAAFAGGMVAIIAGALCAIAGIPAAEPLFVVGLAASCGGATLLAA